MNEDTLAFTAALFGNVPDHLSALLWTLQDKSSTWVSLADGHTAVGEAATSLAAQDMDVYVAVSVARGGGASNRRIASDNSVGLMGLWADIDIADPDVHKKWNLPPDEKSALDLLERAGVEPSLIIHSGHGLQAWWLFDEFWEFENGADRLAAADLAQRWNKTLRVRAAEQDWTVDSTFDLARVMRVPGTMNRKGHPIMPVRLIAQSPKRYGRDDFDAFCVDDALLRQLGITPTKGYITGPLELADSAYPNGEMLDSVRENDPLFEKTWRRERKEWPDQSQSSYDMSIASILVAAGWNDQQIVNTIIAHRRKHNQDVGKALRQDYMSRTIARARETASKATAYEDMEVVSMALEQAKRSGDDEEVKTKRRDMLATVGDQLGLEVTSFIRYVSDPPQFAMVTPAGTIHLGESNQVMNFLNFRARVWESAGHLIDRFKNDRWDKVVKHISDCWINEEVGAEATTSGQVNTWLTEFLMARPPMDDDGEQAALTNHPFTDGQGTHIFGPTFKRWLWVSRNEKVSNPDLGRMLRQYGCTSSTLHVKIDGKQTTRSVWTLPTAFTEKRGTEI